MFKRCALLLLLLGGTSSAADADADAHAETAIAQYQLHWQHDFSQAQQTVLSQWLAFSSQATLNTLGPYPFTMQLYLYQRPANEPVPWANTWRETSQQVHFYVAPQFSKSHFIADWTAYHEMAHLALPYLGRSNAWFAEGFASYMQYQIMQQAGLIDNAAIAISDKFAPQRIHYLQPTSMAATAALLLGQRRFPAGYWGGAQFFVVADRQLQQQGKGKLTDLIARYQQCCRLQDNTLEEVITSLDKLSNSKIFSELIQQFNQLPAEQFISLHPL